MDLAKGQWLNQPASYTLSSAELRLTTESNTDFWQRTYYGFRNDNAPALLFNSHENISFTCRVDFNYKVQFDQCGVCIYIDSDNWFKASIEFENEEYARLGSVVTQGGYSDWATTDIAPCSSLWYRLHRRGPDFLIEYSHDGRCFKQMRIFHIRLLGDTSQEMARAHPPLACETPIRFGLYACSPGHSSFVARFTECSLQNSLWQPHG